MTETMTERAIVVRIPMSPPACLSPNKRSRRGGHFAVEAATRELRQAAWAAVLDASDRLSPRIGAVCGFSQPVSVHEHIIWPRSKGVLPDPDALASYCKPALDGIVDAGLLAGDSAKHIASVSTSQEKGTDTQGWTIITIKEIPR